MSMLGNITCVGLSASFAGDRRENLALSSSTLTIFNVQKCRALIASSDSGVQLGSEKIDGKAHCVAASCSSEESALYELRNNEASEKNGEHPLVLSWQACMHIKQH